MQGFPLSPPQKHLWRLHQEPGAPPYRTCCAVRIDGNPDRGALILALRRAVDRHEILRTSFRCLPGMSIPLQVVAERGEPEVCEHDLSALGGAARTAAVERLRDNLESRPVDPASDRPLAACLITLAPGELLLLLTLPALCADRLGIERLAAEIARCQGGAPAAADGEVLQYPDLAEWQNEMLHSAETRAGGELWRRQDWSSLGSVRLACERRETAAFAPRRLSRRLPAALVRCLEAVAQRHGASLETLLRVCWQILLLRWSGVSELVLGVAYDGRNFDELRDAVGIFARYLPVRCRWEEGDDLGGLLAREEETAQRLAKWQQHFSWELVAEGETAFAPFCFEVQEPPADLRVGGAGFSIVHRSSCIDRFALKLCCHRGEEELAAELHYDAGRFAAEDVALLADSFHALLESAAERPEPAVGELETVSRAEFRCLYGPREPGLAPAGGGGVHREVERQAARRAGEWAVVCGAERLTYGELNRRANHLARYLRALGVGLESRVAICLERSVETVQALLAVLKAGGGYVPLDPSLPKERLLQLLRDSGAGVLLTRRGAPEVPAAFAGRVVLLDEPGIELESGEDLEQVEGRLAYLMYTSGSTGAPKGVAVEHAQLQSYVRAILRRLGDVAGTHWATVSTFAADLGNTSIFASLCEGGCLHVIPQDCVTDPALLREYLASHPIDGLKIVPGHLSALLGASEPRELLPRRWLVLGGEACGWELVERVRRAAPQCRVLNHYGPTETTVGALTWEVRGEATAATVPLGHPLPNSRVYVLDAGLRGVPAWVAGEVYIGGTGVARGYLNRPRRTAERFVPDPFGPEPGGRLYRTGDRARCLPGGELEFLGRMDDQVKIRGFRVEPGEIEAALRAAPGVEAAAVVAREDAAGERRLIGYVVPAGEAPDLAVLRAWLGERLPPYMVPSSLEVLAALPRTANGKLDRAALPAPREAEAAPFVPPRTPVEEMVASLWSGLLGRDRVGAQDDFFALGGHSLLATQLLARLREVFAVEISLRTLFDEPTVAGLARGVEEAIRAGAALPLPPLEPAPRPRELPLSFAQQRLWFLDQMEPGNPFYNLAGRFRVAGRIDAGAWKATLTEIVRRHEILRTTFPTAGGRPVQAIAPPGPVGVPVVDLAGLSAESREREALRLAAREAKRPFDLARGPLFRSCLLRLGAEEHAVFLSMHHIVSDGWSMGVLMREVPALYEAFARGAGSPLPELAVQYADFSLWQRRWLQGEALEALLAYWRRRLSALPAALPLPFDRPRPAVQRFRGAAEDRMFPGELTRSLEALSRRQGGTVFMTLLAAFDALLHRFGGGSDIVVGSPIANRRQAEVEDLVGFFSNMLVLRARVDGDGSFDDLLQQVREVCLDAYVHQDLPFEKLVEELQPERDLSRTPLFQVALVLQNTPRQVRSLPGLTLGRIDVENEIAKFDLTLRTLQTPQGLLVSCEYDTALFDATTIRRLLGSFELLLEEAATAPREAPSRLPLLTAGERHQLLCEWADAGPEAPGFSVLHQGFELQARRRAEAVAVTCEDESLTYGELSRRANRLAHHLRRRGVRAESPVALLLDRSLDMVVGILAVLKAGGAYVPLDPAYPRERLAFALADSGAALLVTCERLLDAVPERAPAVLCLDREFDAIERQSADDPAAPARGDDLAYVIYTSGSTGRPKGVAVEHRNAVRLFTATERWFGCDGRDVWTLFHSYAFDFSVWEIWGALLYGGRLVVVPQWVSRSPEAFCDLLRREQVTMLSQTPSAFRQLSAADESSGALADAALRWVVFGGEALDLAMLRPWLDRHGDERPRLANMYGITETTVHVTFRRIAAGDLGRSWMSLVGRAIPDLRVHLLDGALEPVPIGVPGEILVGGAGVARGYLGRPGETALRFLPDPFSAEPGARLYRSGDLARLLPGGELEYLGRVDFQVKVRGFRIDPGEIQAVLSAHPDVREAVVVARDETPGEKRLVGYFVARDGAQVAAGALRAFLKERLPDYMVPAVLVAMDALPLTSSGKVDRRALPAPGPARPELGEGFVASRTAVEELLAGIWRQVLGLERIGTRDNFFELGGDSILAIQIIARANQAGLRLTPKQLFQHQTVEELAAVAGTAAAAAATDLRVEEGPVPLTPIQRWFFEQPLPAPHHWNQAVLLEIGPEVSSAMLWTVWRELIAQHHALHLRFARDASGWRQVQTPPGAPGAAEPFAEIDLAALPGPSRSAVLEAAAAEVQGSLDLSRGPLLRVVLFRLGPGEPARLLIVIHHLVVDGVSWRVLLGDLHQGCEQLCRGERLALAGQSASYAAWARRLREYGGSGAGAEEVEYWSAAERWCVLPLPLDRPGANIEAAAGVVQAALSVEETEALLHELPAVYNARVEEVLLTALVRTWAGLTGARSLLVDLESHGREDVFPGVDLSRTVGWFTSIFPVLLDLPAAGPGEALRSVKEQIRRIPHRGFHYGLLCSSERNGAAPPRPQVSFNYLGQLDQMLPGARLFSPARESTGPVRSPLGPRSYVWQVAARVLGRRLQVSWTYSTQLHAASTIERLAATWMRKVRELIAHCLASEEGGYTPADFPLAQIGQQQLDRALGQVRFESD